MALASHLDPWFCFSASHWVPGLQSWPHWCQHQVQQLLFSLVSLGYFALFPDFGTPLQDDSPCPIAQPWRTHLVCHLHTSFPTLPRRKEVMDDPRRQNTGSSSWNTLQSSRDLIKIQIPEPFSTPPESRGVCFNPLPRECRCICKHQSHGVMRGCCLQAHIIWLWNRKLHQTQLFFFPPQEKEKRK